MRRCVYPRRGRGLTEGVTACAVGAGAHLRHAEVVVEENPGTLRCALRTGLWKSAVALRRESANPGSRLYNRSSAVDVRASVSRGRQANPVLTYETALRRFFAYGGVLRRWRNQMMMADDVRGNRRRRGSGVPPARRGCCRGESRHATLRFAYRVMEECRRSATRECKPRVTFIQPLFGGRCACIGVTG